MGKPDGERETERERERDMERRNVGRENWRGKQEREREDI